MFRDLLLLSLGSVVPLPLAPDPPLLPGAPRGLELFAQVFFRSVFFNRVDFRTVSSLGPEFLETPPVFLARCVVGALCVESTLCRAFGS